VDQLAQIQQGAPFVALSEAAQDALLQALEVGKAASVPHGAEFFAMVRDHVLEGVFCEPSYGGNRDLVGWRIVGFPGQRTGYPDAYIDLVVDLPPVAADGGVATDSRR
jgi:gluconate 2-dehydrogenase gamma chain